MATLFEYIGEGKLNELILPNPYNSAGAIDKKLGPNRYIGLLGEEFKISQATALKQSNTTIGTLYGGTYKLVRVQPDFATVLLTDIIVGRPMFWNDKKKNLVTPLATATSQFAGICVVKMTSANAKGDFIIIAVPPCEVAVLLAASLTKSAPVINDPVVLSIASSLATADVLADATAWTNVQMALKIGKVLEAWTGGAGLVKKMYLDGAGAVLNLNDGIKG